MPTAKSILLYAKKQFNELYRFQDQLEELKIKYPDKFFPVFEVIISEPVLSQQQVEPYVHFGIEIHINDMYFKRDVECPQSEIDKSCEEACGDMIRVILLAAVTGSNFSFKVIGSEDYSFPAFGVRQIETIKA